MGKIDRLGRPLTDGPWRGNVRAVAVTNVALLSGEQTIDGVACITGDRVLLSAQSGSPANNGAWVVSTGTWRRPADFATPANVLGARFYVEEGTQAGSDWQCTTLAPITVGTTPITISQVVPRFISLPDGYDLNNAVVRGVYNVFNPANGPSAGYWTVEVFTNAFDVDSVYQRAALIQGGTRVEEWIRRRNFAGTWEAWNTPLVSGSATLAALTDVDSTRRAGGKTLVYNATTAKNEYVFASAQVTTETLNTFMDIQYGTWTYRTGVGTGTDAGPAMQAGLLALQARYGNRGKLYIPSSGQWLVTTPPSAASQSGMFIEGDGSQATQIVFNNNAGILFFASGAAARTGGGVKGIGVLLESGMASSTSTAIALIGDATNQPDKALYEDLYVTAFAGSFWSQGIFINGSTRTSPQGIRETVMRQITIFNCSSVGLYVNNMAGGSLVDISLNTPKPTTAGADAVFADNGAANTRNVNVRVDGLVVGGLLNLSGGDNVTVRAKAATVFAATTFNNYDVFVVSGAALSGAFGAKGRQLIVN